MKKLLLILLYVLIFYSNNTQQLSASESGESEIKIEERIENNKQLIFDKFVQYGKTGISLGFHYLIWYSMPSPFFALGIPLSVINFVKSKKNRTIANQVGSLLTQSSGDPLKDKVLLNTKLIAKLQKNIAKSYIGFGLSVFPVTAIFTFLSLGFFAQSLIHHTVFFLGTIPSLILAGITGFGGGKAIFKGIINRNNAKKTKSRMRLFTLKIIDKKNLSDVVDLNHTEINALHREIGTLTQFAGASFSLMSGVFAVGAIVFPFIFSHNSEFIGYLSLSSALLAVGTGMFSSYLFARGKKIKNGKINSQGNSLKVSNFTVYPNIIVNPVNRSFAGELTALF